MVTKVDGRWTVIGLTSWSFSCAKKDSPSTFSKVSSFVYMLKQDIGLSLHHIETDLFQLSRLTKALKRKNVIKSAMSFSFSSPKTI